jgi:hypothetical protein
VEGTSKERLAIRRSDSVENKLDEITCNTFGLTPVASIRTIAPNSRTPLTLCFACTVTLLDATFIYRMCPSLPLTATVSKLGDIGNRIFGKADCVPWAGRFKSSSSFCRILSQ